MNSIYLWWKSGELDKYIKADILKSKVVDYCKIYDMYIQYVQLGYKYSRAVELTAEKFPASEITVKRAIAMVI